MKATIDIKDFKRVIKALKPFTRQADGFNDKMQYIYLEFDKEAQEVRFEALDGHRIAIEYLNCAVDENFKAYIKPYTPWKTERSYTDIEMINGIVTIDMGEYCLRVKQPDGEWYGTKQMIHNAEQEQPLTKICINPSYVIDAIKNINHYSEKGRVLVETRGMKDMVVFRETKDKRNARYILPMSYRDDSEVNA